MELAALGVESNSQRKKDVKIQESEVKPTKIDIANLEANIEAYELEVLTTETDNLKATTVQTLMKLY